MSDNRVFRLRVVFVKQGRLAMLSHLEIARALERVVRRAGLPFAVSQGFSPHMKIAFGAALPVGVGGMQEIFDLQMTDYVAPAKALAALQGATTPDLMCTNCFYIEARDAAASVAYPLSTYRARLSSAPGRWQMPDEVRIVRKKKEKVLRPADFLVGDMRIDGDEIEFTLEAKESGSLRPDVLMAACLAAVKERCENDGLSTGEVRLVSLCRVRQETKQGVGPLDR